MDGTRNALIIASSDYQDPGLRRLRAPGSDAQALGDVLRDPRIGDFDVRTLLDEPAHVVTLAVEEFFADRGPDDLLLVHFSGHGIKDEDGELYFAAANTRLDRLGATAVAAEFVNRRMSRSRSRRIVLLLDCCYAGAFERGMTARAGTGVAVGEQFGGRGRAVITASSAMEYAFEGGELSETREPAPSVFTSALVQGLRTGDADRDQDGNVGLDELYDYIYDQVRSATPHQTPGKWSFGVQGELCIARSGRPVTAPAPLPAELRQAIASPFAGVRAGVVPELERLLRGPHAGQELAARRILEQLAEDDSRMVAAAAAAALDAYGRAGPSTPLSPPVPRPATAEPPEPKPAPAEGAHAGRPQEKVLAQTAAVPARAPAATPAQEREDRRLLAAGGLAIISAIVSLLALIPTYMGGGRLTQVPANTWSALLAHALVVGAGLCVLLPRTRRSIGPGALLGAAALAPNTPIYILTLLAVPKYGSAGPGLWLDLAGALLLMGAAGVTGVALVRAGQVRLVFRRPGGVLPWLVAVVGLAGSVAVIFQIRSEPWMAARAQAFVPAEDLAPHLWVAAMALIVPVTAVIATPRRFGAALLIGWIGSGVVSTVFVAGFHGSPFGYTVLALAAVAIPFAASGHPRVRGW